MSVHEFLLSDEKMIILARHSITSQNPLFQTNCNCLANDLQAVLLLNPVFMNYERRIKGVRVDSLVVLLFAHLFPPGKCFFHLTVNFTTNLFINGFICNLNLLIIFSRMEIQLFLFAYCNIIFAKEGD